MAATSAPAEGEIHVWRFSLADDSARASRLEHVLSHEERARAARFHFERDQRRFVIARAIYRDVLAPTPACPPSALPLTAVAGEKPRSRSLPYSHNLSHAHELGVVAVAARGDLGIDVDYIHRTVEMATVARAALTPREHAEWEALPAAARRPTFFSLWTRKEAVLKATGDPKAFEFGDMDAAAITLAGAWSLATFFPADGYCGAIALRSSGQVRPSAGSLRFRFLDHG